MLNTVTISGADDGVDPEALFRLYEEFPFVEWGILFSEKRSGLPRYPSKPWINRLASYSPPMRLSAHLCGDLARRAILGDFEVKEPENWRRVQLNGVSIPENGSERVKFTSMTRRWMHRHIEWIFQCRDYGQLIEFDGFAKNLLYGSKLFDPSAGRGVETRAWPQYPPDNTGYAGGIKPSTVVGVIREIEEIQRSKPQDYWIDMESGVRDASNVFDLYLVRQVLEAAKPFVDPRRLRPVP